MASYLAQFITQLKLNKIMVNLLSLHVKGFVEANAQSGTARALVNAMVIGVTEGFTKKVQLVGVGYRAQIKGNAVALSLGFSHPVEHTLPAGITAECPSQAEIVFGRCR